jgi:predicted ATPase/class 3 adenylate cyclase
VECPNCGSENRPGAKFCKVCGTSLSLVCPNGHPVEAGAQFCDECGAQVLRASARVAPAPPATLPATPAQPTGERRLVSVLFADLVGFTTLSESRDVEEVRELLSGYFDTCRRLISRYGGTVEKFIGDAVMAVWGTPVAREDDAERAVRAALELVDAISVMGASVGAPDLRARAGVLTGEAAVMIGGTTEGMVAGDLVNTASRVQSAAQPGTVFVGESTRRASDAAIVYEDAGIHTLKGKAEPMQLFRAERVIAGIGGSYKPTGLEPPFVGRDREMRQVKDLFHATIEDRKAHLVSVIGIAGIGKSRLAWEFFKYIDGQAEGIYWHRGRCLSYGEGVSYWALAEMVRMRAGIVEGEDQATASAKLRDAVEQNVSDPDERKWIEPRLSHLLGLEERAARDSEDLFAAWRVFFERLAEQQPVVMVFEDMQWADAGLIEFIEYLTNWSRTSPIYVVTSGRPEFLERHPDWGAGKRAFTSLYLEPLARDVMQEMLDGVVPGLADEIRNAILERAEGVPLYAVETVRMLLDKGLLEAHENAYRVTGPIETLEVPETLHALIAARLDGLNEEERRTIQDASVLGKTFTAGSVTALTGLAQAEMDQILASLVRKEVLALQTDFRSPEAGQYGFLQDLVRRVAYETMSKKERKARHLAAARLLEEGGGADDEEIVEVLASHYVEAYQAAPDAADAQDIKGRARAALVGAAKRAGSLAASQEARRYYEQALELADEDADSAALQEGAGQMAWLAGDLPAAKEHAEAARATYERLHDDRGVARASVINADVLRYQGRLEDAIVILKAALSVLENDYPDESTAMLAERIARGLLFTGHLNEALDMVERALAMGEKIAFPSVMSLALNTKALVLTALTRPQEAILLLRHALQIALDNNLGEAALRAYNNIGAIMNERDQHQQEYDSSKDGLELARKLGNKPWEEGLTIGKMTPCLYLGRWDECLAVRDEAIQLGVDFSGSAFSAEWLMVVPVHVWRAELDEARNLLSLSPLADAEDLQVRQTWHAMNSLVSRAEGKHADAISSGEIAFSLRTEMGIRAPGTKEAFVQLMEACLDADDLAKGEEVMAVVRGFGPGEVTPYQRAQYRRFESLIDMARGGDPTAPLREVIRAFEELKMPFWKAVASTELAEWFIGRGRDAEAAPLAAQARATFEQLRATPWLERLDKSGALETLAQAT